MSAFSATVCLILGLILSLCSNGCCYAEVVSDNQMVEGSHSAKERQTSQGYGDFVIATSPTEAPVHLNINVTGANNTVTVSLPNQQKKLEKPASKKVEQKDWVSKTKRLCCLLCAGALVLGKLCGAAFTKRCFTSLLGLLFCACLAFALTDWTQAQDDTLFRLLVLCLQLRNCMSGK